MLQMRAPLSLVKVLWPHVKIPIVSLVDLTLHNCVFYNVYASNSIPYKLCYQISIEAMVTVVTHSNCYMYIYIVTYHKPTPNPPNSCLLYLNGFFGLN